MNPWVRTSAELAALVDELADAKAIGLDIEGDSLHHYTEQTCLIQVSSNTGGAWLVDPLAGFDLSPLSPILREPTILKVFHAGDNDVTAMRRDFGFTFRTLFDTSIAARLLGDTELGLQAIVRNELGIELTKGSQKDDWSRRPLTEKQEAYALADVHHLMELAARFTARLAEAGRTEWAREEFAALAALADVPRVDDRTGPDEFRRIKGSAKLTRRQQAVLRELYAWREERARLADRPPFKVVAPDVLLALAADSPTNLEDIEDALASFPRQRDQAGVVLAAIERGLAAPEPEREQRGKPPSRAAVRLVEKLREWRDGEAKRTGLDPSIILPTKLLERVATAAPTSLVELAAVDGMRRWRVAKWGADLLAITSTLA